MLKCCKVAVTGTVSSGKSSVCRILRDLGAHVVDADAIVHRLLSPETDVGKKVISLLGSSIVSNGRLDRAKIAAIVFDNSALLRALENILHPAVQQEIAAQYQQVNSTTRVPLFVAEIPLLFESNSQGFYDWIIVVTAHQETCRQRFMQKTHYGEQEFNKRSSRLIPLEEKRERADFVIENNGDLVTLEATIKEIYPKLLKPSK